MVHHVFHHVSDVFHLHLLSQEGWEQHDWTSVWHQVWMFSGCLRTPLKRTMADTWNGVSCLLTVQNLRKKNSPAWGKCSTRRRTAQCLHPFRSPGSPPVCSNSCWDGPQCVSFHLAPCPSRGRTHPTWARWIPTSNGPRVPRRAKGPNPRRSNFGPSLRSFDSCDSKWSLSKCYSKIN